MNTADIELRARGARRVFVFSASSASSAFLVYVVLTLAFTWPLARGLAHDVPSDFGDPLFTMWVMAWDATHLGSGWWNANIFHPHPLALAYSEHFLPQALQALPIYFVTANPILGYNVVFLSTFVLSGLGMFLFTRDLTGRWEGAMVAGLAYAFAPYRVASLPHLHVLSSAWLPFVLLGFRRYLATGRMPRGLRTLGAYALGYSAQTYGYSWLLTDTYAYSGPPALRGPEQAQIESQPVQA